MSCLFLIILIFDFFADIWFDCCQEADFIPYIFWNEQQRELVIDFNDLQPQDELLSILSYTKAVYSGSPFKIFNSFSPQIWILIAVSFVLYGTLNWLNMRREHRPNGNRLLMLTNFSEMFALLLGQGRFLHPIVLSVWVLYRLMSPCNLKGSVPLSSRARLRNPLIIWIFCTVLLRQLFSSDIMALLLSRADLKIDYFDQLYHLPDDYRFLIERGSLSSYYFNKVRAFDSKKDVCFDYFDYRLIRYFPN